MSAARNKQERGVKSPRGQRPIRQSLWGQKLLKELVLPVWFIKSIQEGGIQEFLERYVIRALFHAQNGAVCRKIRGGKVFHDFTTRIIYGAAAGTTVNNEMRFYDGKLNHLYLFWRPWMVLERRPGNHNKAEGYLRHGYAICQERPSIFRVQLGVTRSVASCRVGSDPDACFIQTQCHAWWTKDKSAGIALTVYSYNAEGEWCEKTLVDMEFEDGIDGADWFYMLVND